MSHQKLSSQLSFATDILPKHKALEALNDLEDLIDWNQLTDLCQGIYSAKSGRPSYPLLVMLRALLLGAWYNLSDSALENQLARDLLFRKFCKLDLDSLVPDQTTLSRFRSQLVKAKLWEKLLNQTNHQLMSKNIIISEGAVSIIDASVVEAHQSRKKSSDPDKNTQDPEAGWNVKNDSRGKQKTTYGYKLHVNSDEDGYILKQRISPGNEHDTHKFDELLTGQESQVYADSAYASKKRREKLKQMGVTDYIQAKGHRSYKLNEQEKNKNQEIGFTRSTVERVFGIHKLHHGLQKTRFMGLAKNEIHFGILAIVNNLKRALSMMRKGYVMESSPKMVT